MGDSETKEGEGRTTEQDKKKEVWERYKKRCDERMELAETIVRWETKYVRQEEQRGKIEQMWVEVKGRICMLEDWVRKIAKEEGFI